MTLKVSRNGKYPEIHHAEYLLGIQFFIAYLVFLYWVCGLFLKPGMSFFSFEGHRYLELFRLVVVGGGAFLILIHRWIYIKSPVVLRGKGIVRRRWSFFEVQTIIAEPCYFEIVEDVQKPYSGGGAYDIYVLYLRGPRGSVQITSDGEIYNYISISKELGIPIKMKRLGGREEWLT